MTNATERPVCLIVIGWGAIVLGILMGFSGAMAALMSQTMDDVPRPAGPSAPSDFFFEHFTAFAVLQVALAVLLAISGRALLRLRRWASRVIEAVAWLGVLYGLGFTAVFAIEASVAASEAPTSPSPGFMALMVAMCAFTLAFWGTPLILTIRNLRSERVRRVLV